MRKKSHAVVENTENQYNHNLTPIGLMLVRISVTVIYGLIEQKKISVNRSFAQFQKHQSAPILLKLMVVTPLLVNIEPESHLHGAHQRRPIRKPRRVRADGIIFHVYIRQAYVRQTLLISDKKFTSEETKPHAYKRIICTSH